MTTATMTSKGQITIPAAIRQRLGLDNGDRVEFIETADGSFAIRPANDDVRSLKGLLRKPAAAVSLDDMAVAVRRRVEKRRA